MAQKDTWWLPDPTTWRETWRDDWRVMGQEGYLMNKHLQHRRFNPLICSEDFTQCEFCWDRFDEIPEHSKIAYFEPITKCWICEKCFKDFQSHFHWTVEEISD